MFQYILTGIGIALSIWAIALTAGSFKTADKARILEEVVEHLYEGKPITVGVHHEKGSSD